MEAPFGGPLQRALIGRRFLEGPLFVHFSANKGPLCGGPFMGSTYRGPNCGGRMKRAPLWEPYEEDPFDIIRGLFWIVSLQKTLFGYGKGSMQGAFLRKAPMLRALFGWFRYKELLGLAEPHFAKGSLLGAFCRGIFVERHFAKGGSSSVRKCLFQSICRFPVLGIRSRTWYKP